MSKKSKIPYTRTSYHTANPVWRRREQRPVGQLAGIELEIEGAGSYQEVLEALPHPTDASMRPITETDGSLNYRTGVEIVFPPMKYSQLKNGNSFFVRSLRALEDAGCGASPNCGMHVNINTVGWSQANKLAFIAMHNVLPTALLEMVGGRPLNRYCEQLDMSYLLSHSLYYLEGLVARSHTTVASSRDNRVELRYPAATTNPEKVRLVLDFSMYVEMFVKSRAWNINNVMIGRAGHFGSLSVALELFALFVNEQPKNAAQKRVWKVLQEYYDLRDGPRR